VHAPTNVLVSNSTNVTWMLLGLLTAQHGCSIAVKVTTIQQLPAGRQANTSARNMQAVTQRQGNKHAATWIHTHTNTHAGRRHTGCERQTNQGTAKRGCSRTEVGTCRRLLAAPQTARQWPHCKPHKTCCEPSTSHSIVGGPQWLPVHSSTATQLSGTSTMEGT
jgi:hypothetical protein